MNSDPRLKRGRPLGYLLALIVYCSVLLMPGWARGQTKAYADLTPSSGRDMYGVLLGIIGAWGTTNDDNAGQVVNAANAGNDSDASYAELKAGMKVVVGTGHYGQSWIQLKYDHTVPANTPTYIRLGQLEKEGGGLDVLGLVTGDILGLISNEIIIPSAHKGASSSSNGTSVNATTNLLRGQDGFLYAVVTPKEAYNSVGIKLRNADNPLLGLLAAEFSTLKLKVYNAFYYKDINACSPALFSDLGNTTGITVKLGDAIKNPSHAIDKNTSSYSEISTGTISVLASATQNIYFPTLSETNSTLKVRLGITSSGLNLDLLGAYSIRVYNGNTLVQTFPLQAGLINGLDLLGLLGKGGATTLSFDVTKGAFDRVEIGLFSTLNVNLAASTLRIYNVSRNSASCPEPAPTVSPLKMPVCANTAIVSSAYVDDAAYATDGNFDSYASIRSGAGILLGLGDKSGHLEVNFPTAVPANKTTYIRIDYEPEVLNALLAGSLGNTVSGLVNTLLLGNHYFDLKLTNSGTKVLETSSSTNFDNSNGQVRIVQDAAGHYYIAVRATQPFTNIRITDNTVSGVGILTPEKFLNVYNICYENGAEACDAAFSTSYSGTGITLDLLNLGKNGVQNAEHAIDGDPATASKINLGLLSVAGSMSQYIHFNALSDPAAVLKIKMAIKASKTLSVDLLGAYEIVAYDGNTEVYRRTLASGLVNGTNILDLLGGGQPGVLTFAPGKAFDRVEIRVNSGVGVSALESAVEVYDVKRYGPSGSACADPDYTVPSATVGPFDQPSCAGALGEFANVDFPQHAVDGNNETFATLHADAGTLLLNGPTAGFIEMNLGQMLPANKTTYLRVNYDKEVLDRLLGGSLGKLVGDLANNLLLGNQYFQVEAKNGTTRVLNVASSNAFEGNADGVVTLVQDKVGRYYIAITPNKEYDRIRITNHVVALLPVGKKATLDVYNACFELGDNSCFPANFTSYRGGGLNLSLGQLSQAGVTDADHAISDNSSEYSRINLGVAGVAANVYQTVYFNQPSKANDLVRIRLAVEPSSTLSVDLLGSYKVKFFNGKTQVGSDYVLQQGLLNNIDLLALFKSGGIVQLEYTPTGIFDRVEIGIESIASINVGAEALRVYSVKRIGDTCPEIKTPFPFVIPVSANKLVGADNADEINNLFDDDFDSYATLKSGAGTLFGLGNKYEGSVELGYDHVIPAGTTSYIRIDFEAGILKGLVGGSLGNVVSGLLDNLILGDHFFKVEVKNNTYDQNGKVTASTAVLDASSATASVGGNNAIRVVRDKEGRYYIAITPTQDYNAVRITDNTNSALGLLAKPNTMNVYGMAYEGSTDPCLEAFATSYEHSGLNLTVNDLSGAGVNNPHQAINEANTTDYSEISNGTLAVGTDTKQWIFFNSTSAADDVVNIKFKTGAGAVDLNVLGGLEIKAYKGNTEVAKLDWQNGVVNGVNVLNVLNTGQPVEVPFAPGAAFDRISVGVSAVVGLSVLPPVHLYSVSRCYDLDAAKFVSWKSYRVNNDDAIKTVKGGEEVTYTIHVRNTGNRDIHGYSITDKIPDHTSYVPTSGGVYSSATNTVTFDAIDVAVGATTAVSFKVKVDADLTDVATIYNVALVKATPTDQGTETFPPSATDPNEPEQTTGPGTTIPVTDVKTVVSWKAYTIGTDDKTSKTVSGGEDVTYHIYVRNTGNQDLTNVSIKDVLPAGLTWVSGGQYDAASRTVTMAVPYLKVGDTSAALDIVVSVNTDLTGVTSIKNIAVVKADPNGTDPETESFPPTDNTNPTEPDTTIPGTVLDVEAKHVVTFLKSGLSTAANNRMAEAGKEIEYSLTVKNTGNVALTAVSVTDMIPVNTTYVSGGTLSGSTVTLPVGDLAVDQSKTVTFKVLVDAIDPLIVTAIKNTATVHYKDATGADATKDAVYDMQTSCTTVDATGVTIVQNGTFCEGTALTLTASVTGAGLPNDFTVKWFADANLNQFIKEGATLDVTPVAGARYYVLVERDGYCFNGAAAEHIVQFLPTATAAAINVAADGTELCAGVESSMVATATGVQNPRFTWYADAALTQVLEADPKVADGSVLKFLAINDTTINLTNTVYVTVSGDGLCANKPADAKAVTVTVKPAPTITLTGSNIIYVATGSAITWPQATTPAPGTIKWFDSKGVEVAYNQLPTKIDTVAQLAYTVVAKNGDCEAYETIIVNVYDGTKCPPQLERVYATRDAGWGSIITGGVTNRGNAVDGNPKTHSTIVTGVGLLGIGTTWQNIEFDHVVPAGTPVTIKLGKEYSGLMLAGGLSVVGIGENGGDIGLLKPVAGGLLDVLAADNVVEFTFVPANSSGPKKYKGVRISSGALLSVAQLSKVYGVYYTKQGQANCAPIDNNTNPDVLDVLYGVKDLGVGVASATASVVSPWNAVDNDLNTSAKIVRGVAVLNAATLTVIFKNQVMPTDSLRLIMKDPTNTGLSLDLLTGYEFQRFNGGQKAGNPIQGGDVLNLKLFKFTAEKAKLTISSYDKPYDRLQIAYGSVVEANLGDQVEIFDVAIQPTIKYGAIDGAYEICAGDEINFELMDECTSYELYDKDGNKIDDGSNGYAFTIPNTTVGGKHTYYVQAMRYGCKVGVQIPIEVTVNPVPVIEKIELNSEVRTNNTITLAPGETLNAKAFVQENGAVIDLSALQMQRPNGSWGQANIDGLSFGNYTANFVIPANGVIDEVDYRNKSVKLRMVFYTDKGCDVISEVMTLNISASKYDFSGENFKKEAKAGPNAKAVAGEDFVYTVTAKNGGPSTITAGTVLYLQDLPSVGQELRTMVATSANIELGGGNAQGGYWVKALADIPKDGVFTVDVTTAVDPAITANYVENTIKIWITDPNGNYSTPEDGKAVSPQYEVVREYGFDDDAITKVGIGSSATAGQPYGYTVNVVNKGPSTILAGTPVYFQDVLSPGQTLTAVTYNGTALTADQNGLFSLVLANNVAAGANFGMQVNVAVAADAPDYIQNTIHIWQNNPGTDVSTLPAPDGTATTPKIPVDRDYNWGDPDAVKKAGESNEATAGEDFNYTVTLTNKGTSTILPNTVLYLQDVYSVGQTINSVTSDNGVVGTIGSDGAFTLTVANAVPTDAQIKLTVSVKIDADITATVVNNTINIWSKDPAGDYTTPEGTATTPDITVKRESKFGVRKTTDVTEAIAGTTVPFKVVLTNNGPSTAQVGHQILVIEKPEKMTISAADITVKSGNATFDGVYNTQTGEFTIQVSKDVKVGDAIELEILAHVPANAIGTVKNGIKVEDEEDETPEIPVKDKVVFQVVKTTTATKAIAGEYVDFNVVLTNNGPSTAKPGQEIIVFEKPDGLLIEAKDIRITSGNATFDGIYDAATGKFTVLVSQEVDLGGVIELQVSGLVPANAVGTVKNGIKVEDDEDETPEIPVEDKVTFGVVKTTEATKAVAGESVDFKVVLTNNGPSTAKVGRKVLVIEKPTGLVINTEDIRVTSGNATVDGVYDATTGEFTLAVNNEVVVGGTIELQITGHVPADAKGTVKNGIKVGDDEDETPEIPVTDKVVFKVEKSTTATTAIAGEDLVFDVVLTNEGPSTAKVGHKVTVIEKPDGLIIGAGDITVTSGNAGYNGVYDATTGQFTIVVTEELKLGDAITLKVIAHVPADATGTVKNGIEVEGKEDETPEIPVENKYMLAIEKKADQNRVQAGESTTFTLTITSQGSSTIPVGAAIKLVERPGAGVTIEKYEILSGNATVSGTGNNATVTTTAKVEKGQTITVKVTAKVDADAPETITNGISVWNPDKDPGKDKEDDKDDTDPIPVDRTYALTVEKVADEAKVKAGETTTFTVTIKNNGPATMAIGKAIQLSERPGAGVQIDKYEVMSGNATVSGTGNKATVTTTDKLPVGGTIIVRITATVSDEAPETITNGISVWGPDKDPEKDPEDDKDDTDPIPVGYPLIEAVDDVAETKTAMPVDIDVTANDIVTKWAIDKGSVEIVNSTAGTTITVGAEGIVTYESRNDMLGEDSFTYRVKDVKGRWSNTATVRVMIANNELVIPNIITPNGDGKNDAFVIKGIEVYDKVGLIIVNRWGNEVYRSNAYNNDFAGVGLSEGTYFYVLETLKGNQKETHKGWLTIKSN